MKKLLGIVVLGLLISSTISFYYISKYDVYEVSSDDFENHQMIKGGGHEYWSLAGQLDKDLTQGKNFFKTGSEYRISYLPSKTIYALSSLIKLDLYDDVGKIKIDKKKVYLLIIQTILYYLVLLFFYKEIIKHYSQNICLYIIGFLSFEPTLILFHSSFYSESTFFSFQLIFLTLLIKKSENITINFIMGFVLGLLLLQRSVAMFYIFPILLFYIYAFKKNFLKPATFFIFGYILILVFLGYHNYSRSGVFYVNSIQSKKDLYKYMIPSIISKKNKIDIPEAHNILNLNQNSWSKKNNLMEINKIQNIPIEKDRIPYHNYRLNESLRIIIENPIITIKHILSKTMHFVVLDPLRHVHIFYQYEYKGNPETSYYKSEIQKNLIPFRIFYTLFIYIVCCLGLISLFKNNKKDHLLIITISLLYFISLCGWIGNTRYFAPCLIYLSILFGNGLNFFINYKKQIKLKI